MVRVSWLERWAYIPSPRVEVASQRVFGLVPAKGLVQQLDRADVAQLRVFVREPDEVLEEFDATVILVVDVEASFRGKLFRVSHVAAADSRPREIELTWPVKGFSAT